MNRDLYKHNFYRWCHRQHHLQLKWTSLVMNILSVMLLGTGTIVGPLIANVWVLAALSWSSMVLKGILEFRKYDSKVHLSRVAYTSYAKCLTRGQTMNVDELVWTHHMMIDLAPVVHDRIRRRYSDQTFVHYVDGLLEYKRKHSTPSSSIKACHADDKADDTPRSNSVQEEEEEENSRSVSWAIKEEVPLHPLCLKEKSNCSEDTPRFEAISERTFGTRRWENSFNA